MSDATERCELHYAGMHAALEEYSHTGDRDYLELARWHKRELEAARRPSVKKSRNKTRT
jgi:hypothetical protein